MLSRRIIWLCLILSQPGVVAAFSVPGGSFPRKQILGRYPNDMRNGRPHSSRGTELYLSALPSCSSNQVVTVAGISGAMGLGAQFALTRILKKTKLFEKDLAGYTAHNIVALLLMGVVSCVGIKGWLSLPMIPAQRLVVPDPSARWLASVIAGMFICWDVPVSLRIPRLRKPDVVIHHIAMSIVALVGALSLPMAYLFFYFGVSEISSIPLLCYDQLSAISESDNAPESRLNYLKDAFRALAAVGFTCVRAFWFTKVTLFHFLPDIQSVLAIKTTLSLTEILALRFGAVMSVAFTALQLFWFSKLVRVMLGLADE